MKRLDRDCSPDGQQEQQLQALPLRSFTHGYGICGDWDDLVYWCGAIPLCQEFRWCWSGLSLSILWCTQCVLGASLDMWDAAEPTRRHFAAEIWVASLQWNLWSQFAVLGSGEDVWWFIQPPWLRYRECRPLPIMPALGMQATPYNACWECRPLPLMPAWLFEEDFVSVSPWELP